MTDRFKIKRHHDFRQRADYAPESVYCHPVHAWEYIPIHPFADDVTLLRQLAMRPEDCRAVDAWWCIEGDVTLLEVRVVDDRHSEPTGLFATAPSHQAQWVYLTAVLDLPCITRTVFETVMLRFIEAGFPHHSQFPLRCGESPLRLLDGHGI